MNMLAEADEILGWLALTTRKGGEVPIEFFDGAEPLQRSWLESCNATVTELLEAERLQPVPGQGLESVDVSYAGGLVGDGYVALRQRLLGPTGAADASEESVAELTKYGDACRLPGVSLNRIRTVSAKQCRGRVSAIWPHMLEWTVALADGRSRLLVNRMYVGFNGKRWQYATIGGRGSPFHEGEAMREAPFACALAFARRYDWRVCMGYEGGISLSFVTDPVGAREVFRLRDVPEGRSRRAAIRHWVEQHWRQKRDGDKAWVRSHLRGATSFTWNGLRCRVVPSAYDLDRLRGREHSADRNDKAPAE